MDSSFKKLWNDPVWSKVIAAGIVAVFAFLATYLSLWSIIWHGLSYVFQSLIQSVSVPLWLLILLVGFCATVASAFAWEFFKRPVSDPEPTWDTYTVDMFFGVKWRWGYVSGEIYPLNTFCPNCDYQLFPQVGQSINYDDTIEFRCELCQRHWGPLSGSSATVDRNVKLRIQQKLRSGTWRNGDAA